MVIWISGLSAAGKTTISIELTEILRQEGLPVVLLDGDVLRQVWQDDLGFTLENRRLNARRISHLCRMLDDQHINVVAAVLYPFEEWINWSRDNMSQFYLAMLDVPMETLEERDPKGIYAGARSGDIKNVVGVDIDYDLTGEPDTVIYNGTPLRSPREMAQSIRDDLPPFPAE